MKNIYIRKEAELDINEAYHWYESRSHGLGESFIQYVEDGLSRIAFNPNLYRRIHKNIHRTLLRKYPFGIYYIEEKDMVIVIAVMHIRMNPRNWQIRT